MIKTLICSRYGDAEGALRYSTLTQEYCTKKFGMQKTLGPQMTTRAIFFCKQGNKRQALKILKKMDCDKELVKFVGEAIRKVKSEKVHGQKTERCRTLVKCSNPICENVETSIGQFKVCTRCTAVHYCSRMCQKKHWKSAHKKVCK